MEQTLQPQTPRSWPALVGKTFDEAVRLIKQENPDLNVEKVAEGSMTTMDYRIDRVRVFVNEEGVVVSPPTTG
ncbi:unnamed protein product [Candidula unifasciata]|uniref:Uncharacterized protein n=1 Tax=Candidula unifasciata TaxID=100452 RepID=A0A8S3ZL23_9EUPU|nr:unnamed protein product [Candidula unifasciata]